MQDYQHKGDTKLSILNKLIFLSTKFQDSIRHFLFENLSLSLTKIVLMRENSIKLFKSCYVIALRALKLEISL